MKVDCLALIDQYACVFIQDVIEECKGIEDPGQPFAFSDPSGAFAESMVLLEKLGVISVGPFTEMENGFTVTTDWDALERLTYEQAMLAKWGQDWEKHQGEFWREMHPFSLLSFDPETVLSLRYGTDWQADEANLSDEQMMSFAYGDDWEMVGRFIHAAYKSKKLKRIAKDLRVFKGMCVDCCPGPENRRLHEEMKKEYERLGALYLTR